VEGTPEEAKENDRVVFRQGAIVFSLDEFVSQFNGPKPNHIKIDTDGFEVAVVEGALQTFISDSVKSVLIEITDVGEAEARIRGCMVERGFHTDHRINIQDNHSRMRREAKGSKIKNVLFVR